MSDPSRRSFVSLNVPVEERADLRAFVMAAAVLGIPLAPINDFVEYRRVDATGQPKQTVSWFLAQRDPTGRYKTNALYRQWRDPAWLAANPEHPLALMRAYSAALRAGEAHEATGGLILAAITRGQKHAHIPLNTDLDPVRKQQLLDMLDK